MKHKLFVLHDSLGYRLNKTFDSELKAMQFKELMGRSDWKVKEVITNKRYY